MGFLNVKDRIRGRLTFLYGPKDAGSVLDSIEKLCAGYAGRASTRQPRWSERDALLITYGDTVLGSGSAPLSALGRFLDTYVGDDISFLHILPFFPFTSDDGFSVTDYRAVNPELGGWDHVRALGGRYRLMFDAVINHVSASSEYMKSQCGGDPRYRDFLLTADPAVNLSSVVRPRNLPLLHEFDTNLGKKWFWTTFSRDQIDFNFKNPAVLLEILDIMLFYAANGAQMIRLDAIAYLWKEIGTACIHLPQTHEVVKLMRDVYNATFPDVILLTETNVPHRENLSYFGDCTDEAQVIYNFTLPPLILHSLHAGNAQKLTQWASSIEKTGDTATYLNFTASHDGIGVRPAEGILTEEERNHLVQLTLKGGGRVSEKRNSDGSTSPYELNITYFDAVNSAVEAGDDILVKRFLLSQSIPLSFIGIPAIYIHSLLGSRNDTANLAKTGMARSINRSRLDWDALTRKLSDPGNLRAKVLRGYRRLLSIRKGESAFHPNAGQQVLEIDTRVFALKRFNTETGQSVAALHNLSGSALILDYNSLEFNRPATDLLDATAFTPGSRVALAPWQVRWLKPKP